MRKKRKDSKKKSTHKHLLLGFALDYAFQEDIVFLTMLCLHHQLCIDIEKKIHIITINLQIYIIIHN